MSKYTKVNVSGDGSCFFHAVTGFLEMEKLVKDNKTYYKGEYDTKAKELRKKVVNWLRNNLTFKYENGLTIKDDIEDEIRINTTLNSIPDYLQHMSKNSSYAGQIEITATANILKRSIRVYIMKNGTYSNVGLGYEIGKSKSKDITLFHNLKPGKSKGNHFEILFPKSKGQIVTKSSYHKLKSKVNYKMNRKRRSNKRRKRNTIRNRVRRSNVNRKTMRRKTMRRNTLRRRNKRNTLRRRKSMVMGGGPVDCEKYPNHSDCAKIEESRRKIVGNWRVHDSIGDKDLG